MPVFRWKGRAPDGAEMSGTLESTSRDAAVLALKKQNITVTEISESASGPGSRAARRVIMGLLLIGAAALISTIAKGARVHCDRHGDGYDCTVVTTMSGFRNLDSTTLRGVRSATQERIDAEATRQTSRGTKLSGSATRTRVVIANEAASIATPWLQTAMPTAEQTMNVLNHEFAQHAESVGTWQVEAAPAGMALFLAIVGLYSLLSAYRTRPPDNPDLR